MVKFKSRYILTELHFDNEKTLKEIDQFKMMNFIKQYVDNFFGNVGSGQIIKNFQVKYVNNFTNMIIIRIARENLGILLSTLSLINRYEGEKIRFQTLGVSGTIKLCEKKSKKYLEKWLIKYEKNNNEK
jgi:RNase P/RNase MRP subunit POP5